MDIMLPIVTLEQKSYKQYVMALKESNLSKIIQGELIDLLQTALEQTQQAKNMGWI